MSLSEVLSGWMAVAIGPGSHAESFIWAATLCARRAGRSAEDRLLCKQEALGSNPSRSTPLAQPSVHSRLRFHVPVPALRDGADDVRPDMQERTRVAAKDLNPTLTLVPP